jgi:hypothetical protein
MEIFNILYSKYKVKLYSNIIRKMFINKYFERIIKVFISWNTSTVKEIHARLNWWDMLSLPQVYNITNTMVDNWILVKSYWELLVNDKWLDKIDQLSNSLRKKDNEITTMIVWETIVRAANNFNLINTIREDISSKLIAHVWKDIEKIYYDPHPYHLLLDTQDELFDIQKAFNSSKGLTYYIWNSNFLDKHWWKFLSQLWVKVLHTKQLSPKAFYCILWDYSYTLTIPAQVYDAFELIFKNISTLESFNYELYKSLFGLKWRFFLEVTYDADLSAERKSMIEKLMT